MVFYEIPALGSTGGLVGNSDGLLHLDYLPSAELQFFLEVSSKFERCVPRREGPFISVSNEADEIAVGIVYNDQVATNRHIVFLQHLGIFSTSKQVKEERYLGVSPSFNLSNTTHFCIRCRLPFCLKTTNPL